MTTGRVVEAPAVVGQPALQVTVLHQGRSYRHNVVGRTLWWPMMSTPTTLRLGTRGSTLAVAQSTQVADLLRVRGHAVELHVIKTTGDRIQDRPLADAGGKGLFTKELEQALLAGEVDFAVHSYKDVPVTMPLVDASSLTIAAVPVRGDVRDVLVAADAGAGGLRVLAAGAGSGRAACGGGASCWRPGRTWTWSAFAGTSTPGCGSGGRGTSTRSCWRRQGWIGPGCSSPGTWRGWTPTSWCRRRGRGPWPCSAGRPTPGPSPPWRRWTTRRRGRRSTPSGRSCCC